MSAPTPAEAFGPRATGTTIVDSPTSTDLDATTTAAAPDTTTVAHRFPPKFFDASAHRGTTTEVRARLLNRLAGAVGDLGSSVSAMQRDHTERYLDLNLERYRRAAARLDDVLDEFDAALADPGGPPPPDPVRH